MTPNVVTLDFETFPIRSRPHYPPKPVGLASRWGVENSEYATDLRTTHHRLNTAWKFADDGVAGLLFHNAKFDLQVACEGLGMPMPRWDQVHDTQLLAFLDNPHSKALGLKELCETLLGWPPEEKDALSEWVWENRKQLRIDHPDMKINRGRGADGVMRVSRVGEWIAYIPLEIVAPYAIGDVERTYALFQYLYPRVEAAGMLPAYDRLRQVLPIFMENERLGMRVDLLELQADVKAYGRVFNYVEDKLRIRLGAPDLQFDKDADVAEALERAGIVDPATWTLTESGQKSVSKDNLKVSMFSDPQVASALGYRNRLKTCLEMFMKPWLEQALETGGTIHTNWNITRGGEGGTRTGRPSTNNHNFLNLSKDFEGRSDGYVHPEFLGLPHLPLVRKYILPDEGHVFLHRDFSGQELRVFAHFEAGELNAAYNADAATDPHKLVGAKMSEQMGKEFERTKVKILNFQSIYGGGIPAIMAKLECSRAEAKEFQEFHNQALPGRFILAEVLERITSQGLPISTLGGRLYYVEQASYSERFKRWMTWYYKLLNYIVQGSAADLTIQCIIDWYHHPRRDPRCRLLVTVYDEINVSAPTEVADEQMAVLREVMEARRLSVPMLSDGKRGPAWGKLEKCA